MLERNHGHRVVERRRSRNRTQELRLENELPFLVLLAGLKCLVVLPADCLFALAAMYVANDVAARGHVALVRFRLGDVDNLIEEVSLAMLAAEILNTGQ